MRIARALVLSPLVPLLGVGVLGIAMGYRSGDLGWFVLLWAGVLYPLVVVLGLGAYTLSLWLGFTARWHFALGGLLVGAILALGWVYPAALLPTVLFCTAASIAGSATMVVFWHLAVCARAA